MAKYTVTYSCGHSGVVNIIGPHKSRESRLKWLADAGVCAACQTKRDEENRRLEAGKAAEGNFARGLSPLEGSERQVDWAEIVRMRHIDGCFQIYGAVSKVDSDFSPLVNTAIELSMDWLREQFKASWWIDRRDSTPVMLLLESPHMTEDVAQCLGVQDKYLAMREAKAQQAFESEKLKNLNDKIAKVQSQIVEVFGRPMPIKVRLYPDKRVYIGGYGNTVVEFYVDGNRYHKKGELVCKDVLLDLQKVRDLCEFAAASWKELTIR